MPHRLEQKQNRAGAKAGTRRRLQQNAWSETGDDQCFSQQQARCAMVVSPTAQRENPQAVPNEATPKFQLPSNWWFGARWVWQSSGESYHLPTRTRGSNPNPNHQSKPPANYGVPQTQRMIVSNIESSRHIADRSANFRTARALVSVKHARIPKSRGLHQEDRHHSAPRSVNSNEVYNLFPKQKTPSTNHTRSLLLYNIDLLLANFH